jgi:Arc/MetJ family transcription regulator
MFTNIDLDEALVAQALRLTGLKTKKAVVEEGLRTLIRLHDQREVRDLRGRLHWEDGRQETPAKRGRKGRGAGPR